MITTNTWRRITQLPAHFGALTAAAMAAAIAALSFSLHSLAHTHVFSLSPLSKHASFIGNSWQPSPAIARGQ